MRSKGFIAIVAVIMMTGLAGCYGCATYNTLVEEEEALKESWSNVENQYQRRNDLIPALVSTVEDAAALEQSLINALEEARRAAENTSASNPSAFLTAQEILTQRLDMLREQAGSSAELQSVAAYRDLQVQIEGTENRIAVARRKYNEAVAEYNASVRRFPRNVFAAVLGFSSKPSFEAERNGRRRN